MTCLSFKQLSFEFEQWRIVPGFERYTVSSLGRIKNNRNQILRCNQNGKKYPYLWIRAYSDVGKWEKKYLHHLILLTFIGLPPKPHYLANHKNFNIQDNRIENLEWVSPRRNVLHAIEGNRIPKHTGKTWNLLGLDRANEIRKLYRKGWTTRELKKRFNVHRKTINRVIANQTWKINA